MFFRKKRSGSRTYLQIVENRWENGRTKQRVVATLGRLDRLQADGELESLLRSGARFADAAVLLTAHQRGQTAKGRTYRIGAPLVFERLWRETGCQRAIASVLEGRKITFPVERSIFVTVLHRLIDPGSDRRADRWGSSYEIAGAETVKLHHLYRAMAWLGEELPEEEQEGRTPFAPRTTKDLIEERLFAERRDLLSTLDLVFFDTTSIYFEGEGGETLGQRGHSKDHRPDLKQMVVGLVIDRDGRPICCELWPGNTADVKSLVPVVDRLRTRFAIRHVCVVADRGMISKETLEALETRGLQYILGARMRSQKEVREEVLSRAGRYHVVHEPENPDGASPLKVKEVRVDGRRYIVCVNVDQARRDAANRDAIVASLEEQLKRGSKSLVGNKGYRKYLAKTASRFEIDRAKIKREARYDGKWVLRTNTGLEAPEVALKYKQLWRVEHLFRTSKSILETRPIYHRHDATIRGHVFCTYLALVLRKALQDRLAAKGQHLEWADIIRDLDALETTVIEQDGKRFLLRSETRGVAGKVFQAVGVALPPTLQQLPAGSS